MSRVWSFAVLAGLAWAAAAPAQAPRFAWKAGQILSYRVDQTTTVSETVEGSKTESTRKHSNVKCWKVLDVDAAGVATVQLWLASLRIETTTPTGETLVFDSANPDKSTPQLREQLGKYVNQTLAVLRVDNRGRVVEAKAVKEGHASRYESDPPFALTLPEEAVQAGGGWERAYAITLEPPVGTGEKYQAVQKYACKKAEDGVLTLGLTTELKTKPDALADQEPLLEKQTEGEIVFDATTGRLRSARLTVEKELKDHQGEGSSYKIQSTYVEQQVGAN
jgi:hypothetical protein